MPNDWMGVTSSIENNQRVIHIYDGYQKEIIQYNLDRKVIMKRISFLADTLNLGSSPFALFKRKDGYFLSASHKAFLVTDDNGQVLRKWDNYIPKTGIITNWNYSPKFSLRSYNTLTQSMLDDWNIPIHIEAANNAFNAVYKEDFTDRDLFATLDLENGKLRIFPIRFPQQFSANGNSYPMNYLPSFTAMGESRIAYSFGIDDVLYVLNTKSGVIEEFKVSNPNFSLNIFPVDQASFNDPAFLDDYSESLQYYGSLYYDPYREALLRVGFKQNNGQRVRVFELLDKEMNIIAQFEQSGVFSGRPLFFPNEMWFAYLQGYKEDTMKLMRVRVAE